MEDYDIILFITTKLTKKSFKTVLFFRTGLYTFPSSKYKTSLLSKFIAIFKYNIYVSDEFAY